MIAAFVLGGIVVAFGGGAVAWSWWKTRPDAPEWVKRNRKG